MSKFKLPANVTRTFGKIGFQLKKHSPEILIVTGVVGTVASAVMACKASTKVTGVIDNTKKQLEAIKECEANPNSLPQPYSKEDARKDKIIVYANTAKDLGKLYGPALTVGAASIACIFASNNILRKRGAAMAAAYATIDSSFKDYRNRVIDRFGEDLDKELRFNIKPQEVEEKVIDENGEEKTVTKTVYTAEIDKYSDYARFYDDGCNGWTKNPEFNLMFLKRQQDFANELLQAKGHLFLNDVYEMLGIPKTQAGQNVGWWYDLKDPNIDNYVDFGLYDTNKKSTRDFVNGYERVIILDFNVDGNIMHHFNK